jgi:hypothetical protein
MSELFETNVCNNAEQPVEERTLVDYLGDPSNNYDVLFQQYKDFESYKDGHGDPSLFKDEMFKVLDPIFTRTKRNYTIGQLKIISTKYTPRSSDIHLNKMIAKAFFKPVDIELSDLKRFNDAISSYLYLYLVKKYINIPCKDLIWLLHDVLETEVGIIEAKRIEAWYKEGIAPLLTYLSYQASILSRNSRPGYMIDVEYNSISQSIICKIIRRNLKYGKAKNRNC